MGRTVLVTGGGGFIGRWAAAALLARGFEVHIVTRRAPPVEAEGAVSHAVDLFDVEASEALIRDVRPSYLLHLAWNATPGIYWTTPENFTWVAASLSLVRSFHRAGGTRVVVAGSCAEYDWNCAKICQEETTPTVLASAVAAAPYSICKAALQRMLQSYGAQEALSVAWGRMFFQYGPYEDVRRLVPSVIVNLLTGKLALCTHGQQQRSFLYSEDAGLAFSALVESDITGVVNVGSAESVTLAQVVNLIGEIIGRPELIQLGARAAPVNEPAVLLPDITRLNEIVGFVPRESLRSGLEKTINWWCANLSTVVN